MWKLNRIIGNASASVDENSAAAAALARPG